MSQESALGVKWNLGDLYSGPEDAGISSDLKVALDKAVAFEKNYKPVLEKVSSDGGQIDLPALLKDYKEIVTLYTKPVVFAFLHFADQTDGAGRGAFMQKSNEAVTDIQAHLIFWDVLWCRLDAAKAEALMKQPGIENDLHYLQTVRKFAPYTLSEAEEKVFSAKSNTSGGAFSRLFDETLNRLPFYLEEDGKRIQKTEAEVLSLLHSPKRELRKAAAESLAEGLKEHTHLITYIYNMILADHRLSMKFRGYKHPADSRNLSNETDLEVVRKLIDSVKKSYPLVRRYYKLKQRLLGLPDFMDYDRYAPLASSESPVDFADCEKIVLNSFEKFSPEAGKIASRFFKEKWIDAEIRSGKQGGGFCCETTPELHPYILVNYTGNVRDVMTVAHEIGHGIHQYLSAKAGILESNAPLTLSECASVFGEMLAFDQILSSEKDPKKRLGLIIGKIDDNFATVFRQIALTDFELRAHEAGLQDGELCEDALNAIWTDISAEMYGDSVTFTDNFRHGWKYIPHFVHTPFYCYAYAFAQLFVLTLYRQYREKPDGFPERYLKMLELGGSKTPEEIAGVMGLDFRKEGFWEKGLKLLEDFVSEAESLSNA